MMGALVSVDPAVRMYAFDRGDISRPCLEGAGRTYLFAQIRAASRASEDSCSYSLETMWTQRGNSSTFARLRPRSKMRILGSGTPRLNRDLGYGCAQTHGQLGINLSACLNSSLLVYSDADRKAGDFFASRTLFLQ